MIRAIGYTTLDGVIPSSTHETGAHNKLTMIITSSARRHAWTSGRSSSVFVSMTYLLRQGG